MRTDEDLRFDLYIPLVYYFNLYPTRPLDYSNTYVLTFGPCIKKQRPGSHDWLPWLLVEFEDLTLKKY